MTLKIRIMRSRKDLLSVRKTINRPLILDGAIGSLLQNENKIKSSPLWSSQLNLTNPELVQTVHKQYISAGADIITTNTFRTNPAALSRVDLSDKIANIVKKSVEIVFNTIDETENEDIIIAGSNPPAEDSYQKKRTLSPAKLEYNHKKHIELLWENGCDFILNETQSHFDEIKIITKFCSENNIPFVVSLFFDDNLNILSGESLYSVIKYIKNYSPLAISVNCIKQSEFNEVLNQDYFSEISAFYLNAGSGNYVDKEITCGVSPENYLEIIKSTKRKDFIFVGSCCGSNPKHTRLLKDYFNG